jgi:hypothetical protein
MGPLAQARSHPGADATGGASPTPGEGLHEVVAEAEAGGGGGMDDHARIKHNFWRLDAQGRAVHASPRHRAWDKGRLEQARERSPYIHHVPLRQWVCV